LPREPGMLAEWERVGCTTRSHAGEGPARVRAHRRPPYPTGTIHLGHAAIKCQGHLVKSRTLDGYGRPSARMGLPRSAVEMKVEKTHGRVGQEIDAKAFARPCRADAFKKVDGQRADSKRLGGWATGSRT